MVASVSCDGVVEWSNDTLAAQLNESFGAITSNCSRSPVANAAAETEKDTDTRVADAGLAIDAVAEARAKPAAGRNARMSFGALLFAAEPPGVFAPVAAAAACMPSAWRRLNQFAPDPALSVARRVMPVGAV